MSSKKTALLVEKSLKTVARNNGVSEGEVRREIEIAMAAARKNPDPKVRAFWNSIQCKSEIPTLEEALVYIAEMGLGMKNGET